MLCAICMCYLTVLYVYVFFSIHNLSLASRHAQLRLALLKHACWFFDNTLLIQYIKFKVAMMSSISLWTILNPKS